MDIDSASMSAAAASKPITRHAMGAQLITKTLDYMNKQQNGACDYAFQKEVLAYACTGKGTLINLIA